MSREVLWSCWAQTRSVWRALARLSNISTTSCRIKYRNSQFTGQLTPMNIVIDTPGTINVAKKSWLTEECGEQVTNDKLFVIMIIDTKITIIFCFENITGIRANREPFGKDVQKSALISRDYLVISNYSAMASSYKWFFELGYVLKRQLAVWKLLRQSGHVFWMFGKNRGCEIIRI